MCISLPFLFGEECFCSLYLALKSHNFFIEFYAYKVTSQSAAFCHLRIHIDRYPCYLLFAFYRSYIGLIISSLFRQIFHTIVRD